MPLTISLLFAPGTPERLQSAMLAAASVWTGLLTGYQAGINLAGITVYAEATAIDGAGGILGSAGITGVTREAGWTLSTSGSITLDSADVERLDSDGRLGAVMAHEVGHILGFGTLWQANGVYEWPTGRYTGKSGIAAYRMEFDTPGADFVPVELNGGQGTAHAHWDKSVFGSELMTGQLSPGSYISMTTVESFQDIGYTVAWLGEAGSLSLMLAGGLLSVACVAAVVAIGRSK